jgi:hypothetical protein
MIVDPDWLADAVELMTGRAFDRDAAHELAPVLGEMDEVLPWLVLRQDAGGPGITAALKAAAQAVARPQSRRAPGFAVSAPLVEIDRALRDGLHLLVAEDGARADLAEEVHGLQVRRHMFAGAGLGRDYRYRIGRPA